MAKLSRVPKHLAIIMDGNGRWAEQRGLPRVEGHRAGAKTVRAITTACREMGVRYLTLYAFSSENWGRPETEVSGLMSLLSDYLTEERRTLLDNNIELTTIGAVDQLPLGVRVLLGAVKEATRGLKGMRLTLALSYGARDEIVRAAQGALKALGKNAKPSALTAQLLSQHLDTADMPDPDLLIRTSGEARISNFMLWQLAYTELMFIDAPWPEFTRQHLEEAFVAFQKRERRFGLTGAQIQAQTQTTSTTTGQKGNT